MIDVYQQIVYNDEVTRQQWLWIRTKTMFVFLSQFLSILGGPSALSVPSVPSSATLKERKLI